MVEAIARMASKRYGLSKQYEACDGAVVRVIFKRFVRSWIQFKPISALESALRSIEHFEGREWFEKQLRQAKNAYGQIACHVI